MKNSKLTDKEVRTVPLKDLWRIQELRQKQVERDFHDFVIVPFKIFLVLLLSIILLCLVILYKEEIDAFAMSHPEEIAVGIMAVCAGLFVWTKIRST